MADPAGASASELSATHDGVELAGSLWLPATPPTALLVMHPGSGPSDRHNDVYFPPIREALLAAGVAVASFDKRGVGGSSGSWLEAGIDEQAGDLLAGTRAAAELVPGVPIGVFGHSQGGWVATAVAGRADAAVDFVVTSSGPAVTVGDQERYSARRTAARLGPPRAERLVAAVDGLFTLAEAGADYEQVSAWAGEGDRAPDLAPMYGDDFLDEAMWALTTRLAAFDPASALRAVRVPLLAVFGAGDDITPVADSLAALARLVDPELLDVAVLAGGGHRMGPTGSDGFVPGYPDVVVDYVRRVSRRRGG